MLTAPCRMAVRGGPCATALGTSLHLEPCCASMQFLPPLLLDSALSIDFFLFKKVGCCF